MPPADTGVDQVDPANKGDADSGDAALVAERDAARTGMMAERGKRQTLEGELAEARRQLTARSNGQGNGEQPKEHTRAELRQAVAGGDLTQEEADTLHDRQAEVRIDRTIKNAVTEAVTTQNRGTNIKTQRDRYIELTPDVTKEGTEIRAKVETEFNDLVQNHGMDSNSAETELLAMKTALGPVEALRKITPNIETHEETFGVGDDPNRGGGGETLGPPKNITRDLAGHYERLIAKGIYKGWDDPVIVKELKRYDPAIAKRGQARRSGVA